MSKPFLSICENLLFLLLLVSPNLLPARADTSSWAPLELVYEHDVVFGKGGNQDLHAELVYPKGLTTPVPGIIYIHGGGWSGGTHKGLWAVERLAKAGFFTVSIEYRLSGVAKWPAQIEDCKCAVRWMRANAEKFHVDPNKIGAFGDSAGGHLVTFLGTTANEKEFEGDGGNPDVSSAVQAVADFFGPTDFTNPAIYSAEATGLTEGLLGAKLADNPHLWRSASSITYVAAGDPPMLMIHGDADPLVPLAQSTVFADALDKAGVPHQLIIVKNAQHSFTPLPGKQIDPGWEEIQNDVRDFFIKNLGDPRKP